MARTALQEQWGDAVAASISSNYSMPLPWGAGGKRLVVLTPTVGSLAATLPDARNIGTIGGFPSYVVVNAGSFSVTVQDAASSSSWLVAASAVLELRLASADTAAGTWVARTHTGAASSGLLLRDVDEFDLELQAGTNVDIRALCDAAGYAGTKPVRVWAKLEAGIDGKGRVIGSTSLAPALQTGTFPSGSLIRLQIGTGCHITGRGGDGGRGGDVPPGLTAQNGSPGGVGLYVSTDMLLVNYGKVQGGGGGGAGAARQGNFAGPGGGGGAGYLVSQGATGGTGATGFQRGGDGGVDSPGYAGGTIFAGTFAGYAGAGGAPGAAGGTASISGGLAGAAGDAIQVLTGTTLTKVVTGTIDGSEVTV